MATAAAAAERAPSKLKRAPPSEAGGLPAPALRLAVSALGPFAASDGPAFEVHEEGFAADDDHVGATSSEEADRYQWLRDQEGQGGVQRMLEEGANPWEMMPSRVY